jgi:thymidine kinase
MQSDESPNCGITKTWIGPMRSGKTSAVCSAVERHHIAKKNCIIVKYEKDNRYDHLVKNGGIVTHRLDERDIVDVISTSSLADIDAFVTNMDVIGVDEGQFYPDVPEYMHKWAMEGKHVMIACLDATFQPRPFGRVPEIIAYSDHVIKLNAVCMTCGLDAAFSKKIKLTSSTESLVEDIGGDDKYVSLCRRCMFK